MITYATEHDGEMIKTTEKAATWIRIETPDVAELDAVSKTYGISRRELQMALDVHEDPRSAWLEPDDNKPGLIVVRFPVRKLNDRGYLAYETAPLTLFILPHQVVTISTHALPEQLELKDAGDWGFSTQPEEFALHVLWRVLRAYVHAMLQVNSAIDRMQLGLGTAVTNKQLYEIMALQKTLIILSRSSTTRCRCLKICGKRNATSIRRTTMSGYRPSWLKHIRHAR